ncbi:hypothetical protein ACFQS2_00420 [Brachybacterium sp. GCM10030267]|uniref:hypothetical protein n=1 Tax=unclassified Brachybacterium TaxID=2623841 RepID=UPI0036142ACD
MAHLDLTLDVGTLSRTDLKEALAHRNVGLNEHAQTLLAHGVFREPVAQSVHVTSVAVSDLGFRGGARLDQIHAAAQERGLALCPPDTGPYLRLVLTEQESAPDTVMLAGRAPTGAITVASWPLHEDDDYPKGFYLRVVDGRPWLRGYRCDSEYLWSAEDVFAVQRPAE